MKKTLKFFSLVAIAAAVSACGGGGGSSGAVSAEYQITLRADKLQLPTNIGNVQVGQGVYSPYTTTLYVNATVNGQPIPGGDKIFGCNVEGGLASGSLYYLDGNPEHEVEVDDGNGGKIKVPAAYRSITLGSNAGGASFHFHAGDEAGTSRITCSVTDPRDKQQKSASVAITVGGATGKPASVRTATAVPGYLGTKGNTNGVLNQIAIQAFVMDDANQPVPTSAKANLQVAIASGGASSGARLLAGSQSGSVVQVSTTGGVGLFSLASGPNEGSILLEMTADRFDNDVTNGIQDPIVQLLAVPVTAGNPVAPAPDPLELVGKAPDGTNGVAYSYAFSAKGGVAPYTWAALGALPDGLSLSSSGILSGTPSVKLPGTFNIAVRVTDSKGVTATGNFPVEIAATPAPDTNFNQLSINLSGCGSDVNTACSLAIANPASPAPSPLPEFFYQYVLSVSGPGTGNATWGMLQNPSWLDFDTAHGILSITWANASTIAPALQDCTSGSFFITAARGGATTMRKVRLVFGNGTGTCKP